MTLTMNPEIRDLWADALESGKYQQTKGALAEVDPNEGEVPVARGFCCLGVLCDLAVKAGVIDTPNVTAADTDGRPSFDYGDEEDHSYTSLPRTVVEWAGLAYDDDEEGEASDPRLTDVNGRTEHATEWNDAEGATFGDIAAMVRAIPARESVTTV